MIFIKYFFSVSGLIFLAFVSVGWFLLQPLSGNLTRMGNLAERDFGWNSIQPQVMVKEQQLQTPQVIVIGDSFSEQNIWQSVAAQQSGLKFLTFKWDDGSCLEEWLLSLKKRYPSVRYVLLETLERPFLARFSMQQRHCKSDHLEIITIQPGLTASNRSFDVFKIMLDPDYFFRAIRNTLWRQNELVSNHRVSMVPLTRSDLFSNRRSNRMIFHRFDDIKLNWKMDAIQHAVSNLKRMIALTKDHDIKLIVAVIPDKSTAYGRFFSPPYTPPLFLFQDNTIWTELDKQQIAQVNLWKILLPATEFTLDLWLPNDTHFGTKGYIMMGEAVAESLNK